MSFLGSPRPPRTLGFEKQAANSNFEKVRNVKNDVIIEVLRTRISVSGVLAATWWEKSGVNQYELVIFHLNRQH